jgi:hypothetical protein
MLLQLSNGSLPAASLPAPTSVDPTRGGDEARAVIARTSTEARGAAGGGVFPPSAQCTREGGRRPSSCRACASDPHDTASPAAPVAAASPGETEMPTDTKMAGASGGEADERRPPPSPTARSNDVAETAGGVRRPSLLAAVRDEEAQRRPQLVPSRSRLSTEKLRVSCSRLPERPEGVTGRIHCAVRAAKFW